VRPPSHTAIMVSQEEFEVSHRAHVPSAHPDVTQEGCLPLSQPCGSEISVRAVGHRPRQH